MSEAIKQSVSYQTPMGSFTDWIAAAEACEREARLLAAIREAQAETKAITGTFSHPSPAEQMLRQCDEGQAVEHRLGLTRMGGAA